ncbi:MAG: 30S ribosomal protein S4, partial [Halobacteria archaeon]|nr:30S ribosomal protein S4 [Halobacteria archaeon]
ELVDEYGLKNKRELWDAQSELRRYRREARRLLGESEEEEHIRNEKEELLESLRRYGILREESGLDDILSLDVTDILER